MYFFVVVPCASAQRFSFGVVGGGSLTNDFGNEVVAVFGQTSIPIRYYSTSKDYIVGPMVEVRLPLHLSLEVNGLYRPLNYTSAEVLPDGSLNSVSPATVVTWEFPVLAKYTFSTRRVRPFAELGPSFRAAGNLNSAAPSNYGGTVGAGVETHLSKIRIAPAVRYTRWAPDHFQLGQPPRSFLNQAEFLVGFSF
ncbi:MAG: hypothetical protein WB579_05295 [Bryobacteraceae bacterium]